MISLQHWPNRATRASGRFVTSGLTLLLIGGWATASATQSTADLSPPSAASASSGERTARAPYILQTVTVTAERRTENLQETALSATVRSGDQLKEAAVYTLQDLQSQTPSLSIQPPVSSETYINIRGVGIQQTSPVSSNGVAFYVDGVYVPSLIDTVDTFYDIANVEVLRGPQGTLVGSNADGGAIFVNSVKPSFDRIKGYVQQTFGNYGDYRTEGAINLPVFASVAARIAFVHETRDSFTTNIGATATSPVGPTYPPAQNQPGNVDFTATRLQVAYRPNDDLLITARFEPYESRTDGLAVKPYEPAALPLGEYFGKTPSPFYDPWAASHQQDAFLIDYDVPQYYIIQGDRTSVTAAWKTKWGFEVKDVMSRQVGHESDLTDSDDSSAPGNEYLTRRATFRDYTEELDLISTRPGAFQWVAGLYYLNTTGPLALKFTGPTTNAISLISYHRNYAVFASGTYQFTPEWSLTIGGRYSYDTLPRTEVSVGPVRDKTYTTTDSEPIGSAKVKWQASSETLVYASVATGYKAGGDNLDLPKFVAPPYKPETNIVEELGLKTEVLGKRVRLNADIFNSQYRNFQIQETLTKPVTAPNTQNVALAKIWGAEAEADGILNSLRWNLGVSYLKGATSGAFNYVGPTALTYEIPSGTTVPFAPKWMLTAGLQYAISAGDGTITPRIQYRFQAAQAVTIAHDIYPLSLGTTIPGHGTADLMLTYSAPMHWQVQAYLMNLSNREYIASVQPSATAGMVPQLAYGAPRQYGVRLSYAF